MASNPLSKKNIIPRNRKAIPNPASPTPISEKKLIWIEHLNNLPTGIFKHLEHIFSAGSIYHNIIPLHLFLIKNLPLCW